MSAAPRRVRALRLRAGDDGSAQHAATLIADALHTASLPGGDGGPLVVIRRLALGRISAASSAASLALHIERLARDAVETALRLNSSHPERDVVVFADRPAALAELARRESRGVAAAEWFWPAIVPGWRPDRSRADRWRLLLHAVHESSAAVPAAAAVIGEALAADAGDALLASLPEGQGAQWLRRAGWSDAPASADASLKLSPSCLRMAMRWRAAGRAHDDRLLWLLTLAVVGERPAAAADRQLPARVAAAIQRLSPSASTARNAPASPPSSRSTQNSAPASERAAARADDPPVAERQAVEALAGPADAAADPLAGLPTSGAGLLFLIHVLGRLGIAEYIASNAPLLETQFPARLLLAIGERVGLTREDPIARALEPDDPVDRVAASHIRTWLTAVRRYCRRDARIGLVTLIRRPGRVHASPTHVDVTLPISHLDVRVRRLALDVDPGWVPWLGRVVHFHYAPEETHGIG